MGKERILIVEDQEDLLKLLKIIFSHEGYQVDLAPRGAIALEISRKTPPDLVILDVALPDMEGFDVGRALRAHPRTKHTPIVFLTARGERPDRLRGLKEVQAQHYLVKPFDHDELVIVVERVLQEFQRKKQQHPVTNLPTGLVIDQQLRLLLETDDKAIAVLYINGFQIFTQLYGAVASEEVLRSFGLLIEEVLEANDFEDRFVGQQSDDTIVLIDDIERLRVICSQVQSAFNERVLPHYNWKHRKQGYIDVHGVDGRTNRVPLMTLEIDMLERADLIFGRANDELQASKENISGQRRVLALSRALSLVAEATAQISAKQQGRALQLLAGWLKDTISARISASRPRTPAEPIASPYIFTVPVGGDALVGRDDLFRRISTLWSRPGPRNSLLIHGHRRMGKTSIAQAIAKRCAVGPDTSLLYLSVEAIDTKDIGYLFFELADRISEVAPSHIHPPNVDDFVNSSARTALNRYLRSVEREDKAPRIVVVIDEFERLRAQFGNEVFAETITFLRGLTQTHHWIALALVGLNDLDDLRRSYGHPLLGWETLRVGFLKPNDVAQVLMAPAEKGNFALSYTEGALARIAELTAGQPYLVQAIGDQLVEYFNEQLLSERWVRPAILEVEDVQAVVDSPRFYSAADAYFGGVWLQFGPDQPVLVALAPHFDGLSYDELCAQVADIDFEASLERLRRHEIIHVQNERFRFTVPLMQRWARQTSAGAGS